VLHDATSAGIKAHATVSEGALKCVFACIEFLEAQPSPRRHFGSWRCGRGIWAAGLSILAAVGAPELRVALRGVHSQAGVSYTGGDQIAARQWLRRAEEGVRVAANWLCEWDGESRSLALGAGTLWEGLREAVRRGHFS
jgi:hypothetical protein